MLRRLKTIGKIFHDQAVKYKWSEKKVKTSNKNYNKIIDNGIIKLNENFNNFSSYINENYIKNLLIDNNKTPHKVLDLRDSSKNNLINHFISIDDVVIREFIQNSELIDTLSLLFNKNIYLRNDPLIQILNTSENLTNGNFHTDRFMQYSLMLLLEDVTENQTHMEYCKKSHKRDKFDFIIHKNFKECEKHLKKNDFEIVKITGKKGDAFLFNTTGIHRAKYIFQSRRSIFHLNFTNGHNLYPFKVEYNKSKIKEEIFLRTRKNLKFTNGKWKFF